MLEWTPNINAGLMIAHGGWIAILASDDVFPANSLEALFAAARSEHADVAVGPVDEITTAGSLKNSRTAIVARYSGCPVKRSEKALLENTARCLCRGC